MQAIVKGERDKYLTDEEYTRLLEAAKSLGDFEYALLYVAGTLGLRVTEAVRMRLENFSHLDEKIVLVETLKRRGGKKPVMPVVVSDREAKELRRILGLFRRKTGWMFRSAKNSDPGHISSRTAQRIFHEAKLLAGLAGKHSFHSLRHYRGRKLYIATKDLIFVRDQLRHSSAGHAQRYVHLTYEEKAERIKDL